MAAKKKQKAKKHTGPMGGANAAHSGSVRARYSAAKREYHALGTQIFKAGHGGLTPKEYAKKHKKPGKKRAKKRSKK